MIPVESIMDSDYTDYHELLPNTTIQTESLLHDTDQANRCNCIRMNSDKTAHVFNKIVSS